MGRFLVRVTIAHPADPTRLAEVDLLAGTRATLSWVPREIVERLGVPRLLRRPFLLADGRTIERETTGTVVKLEGNEAGVTVVVAEPGDGHFLGATTLGMLGFAVDPVNQRLVPQTLLAM